MALATFWARVGFFVAEEPDEAAPEEPEALPPEALDELDELDEPEEPDVLDRLEEVALEVPDESAACWLLPSAVVAALSRLPEGASAAADEVSALFSVELVETSDVPDAPCAKASGLAPPKPPNASVSARAPESTA